MDTACWHGRDTLKCGEAHVVAAAVSVPAGVLRSTFASLLREAPRTLLARQLLSGAAEPGGWWASQQTFTASAAAGSIVGWLLGLGDRHMDNLLLDRWGRQGRWGFLIEGLDAWGMRVWV